jgi:hypothetical protein
VGSGHTVASVDWNGSWLTVVFDKCFSIVKVNNITDPTQVPFEVSCLEALDSSRR